MKLIGLDFMFFGLGVALDKWFRSAVWKPQRIWGDGCGGLAQPRVSLFGRPCRGTGNERKFPLQNHHRANAPRSQWRVGPVWLARDPPTTCDARRVVWKWGWLPGVLGGPALAAPMAPWAACGVGVGGHVRIAPAPFLMRVGNEGGQSTF